MAIGSKSAIDAPDQIKSDHPIQEIRRSAIKRKQIKIAWKRLLLSGCLGISSIGMTGCTLSSGACKGIAEQECVSDFMIGYRNRAMAEKAWILRKNSFCVTLYGREFKDGFIQGYMEVAGGGNGCTPAMAPSAYWGWQYQSANGQSAINAWFQGFPQGARAAEEDGVGHWQSIRMNGNRQPTPIPAAWSPAMVPESTDSEVTNPFYSEPELVPEPDPETLEGLEEGLENVAPGAIEQIDVPALPEEADSVFEGLFPPVAVGDANDMPTTADAVVAEGSPSDAADDNSLPFSFE
jgi:hypothetical protein